MGRGMGSVGGAHGEADFERIYAYGCVSLRVGLRRPMSRAA